MLDRALGSPIGSSNMPSDKSFGKASAVLSLAVVHGELSTF